jgi:hypothetical protein
MSTALPQTTISGLDADAIAAIREAEAAYAAVYRALPPVDPAHAADKDIWMRLDAAAPLVWVAVALLYGAMLFWVSR